MVTAHYHNRIRIRLARQRHLLSEISAGFSLVKGKISSQFPTQKKYFQLKNCQISRKKIIISKCPFINHFMRRVCSKWESSVIDWVLWTLKTIFLMYTNRYREQRARLLEEIKEKLFSWMERQAKWSNFLVSMSINSYLNETIYFTYSSPPGMRNFCFFFTFSTLIQFHSLFIYHYAWRWT